jgi:predicted GNAT family acetyltransferase
VLKVRPPENVAGRMRLPRAAERDMLVEWYLRFAKDADLPAFEHDPAHAARVIDDGFGEFVLWDVDRAAVAMARRRPIETMGVRIGAVYTPDDKRGRGFAAALTAALAERILSQGMFCCLHADAANAATNRLYQRIGFIKLATFADIMFSD